MRTRITTIVLLSLLALVAALAPSAHAGWVFTESNGDETLISQGKMKTSWENGSLIFDGEKNLLHFIDDRRQLIASGTIDELCEGMNQMMESMFEDIPPEQREMMKKMMQGETGESEVVDKGSGGKIAGFATTRYEVLQDGELREEIWTTDDASLRKEVQGVIKALMKFSSCFDQTGFEPEVGRVANGVAHQSHRLKAIGNGQVPLQAAVAFSILMEMKEAANENNRRG